MTAKLSIPVLILVHHVCLDVGNDVYVYIPIGDPPTSISAPY